MGNYMTVSNDDDDNEGNGNVDGGIDVGNVNGEDVDVQPEEVAVAKEKVIKPKEASPELDPEQIESRQLAFKAKVEKFLSGGEF